MSAAQVGVVTHDDVDRLVHRVVRVVAEAGPFRDLDNLLTAVQSEDGARFIARARVVAAVQTGGKQGWLHTRQKRHGSVDRYTLIEATRAGRKEVGLPDVEPKHITPVAMHQTDMTDPRNHKDHAEGGPIEVIRPGPDEPAALVVPPAPQPATAPRKGSTAAKVAAMSTTLAWEAVVAASLNPGGSIADIARAMHLSDPPVNIRVKKAIEQGWLTIEQRGGGKAAVHLTAEARERLGLPDRVARAVERDKPKPPKADKPVTKPSREVPTHHDMVTLTVDNLLADYPVVRALVASAGELDTIAARLEALGFEDEALAVMARLDSLTPLEREVLRLIRTKGLAL